MGRPPRAAALPRAPKEAAAEAAGRRFAAPEDAFWSRATALRVVVVVFTTRPLPAGSPPRTSLAQGSSIAPSPPDIDDTRALWDGDADGTFNVPSSFLVGRASARDVRHLRETFTPSAEGTQWSRSRGKAARDELGDDAASC